jgi:hypothetical protein
MGELHTNLLQECVHSTASFSLGVTERIQYSGTYCTALCVCYFSQYKEEMLKIYWIYVLVVASFDSFTAMWLRIPFSWDMKMCCWVSWFPAF